MELGAVRRHFSFALLKTDDIETPRSGRPHVPDVQDLKSAGMAELVDAPDLGSGDESCGGSSPSTRTTNRRES